MTTLKDFKISYQRRITLAMKDFQMIFYT